MKSATDGRPSYRWPKQSPFPRTIPGDSRMRDLLNPMVERCSVSPQTENVDEAPGRHAYHGENAAK